MNILYFEDIFWWWRRTLNRLGYLGVLGLILLLISLAFYSTKVLPLRQLTQSAQVEYDAQQVGATPAVQGISTPEEDHSRELSDFYNRLPKASALTEALAQINQLAVDHKLILNSGDYQFKKTYQSAKELPQTLVQYEIKLPVKGDYVQVRRFIADVLQHMPALALESIEIKRETTLSGLVDTRLVFVLFMRDSA
jgi:Tfp pilus assembly protein PilO